jgi:HSP20 family protein
MTLIRWNPNASARDLATMRDEMDRLFDTFVGRSFLRPFEGGSLVPPVDIEETPESFVFKADLPGIDPREVKVSLHGDTLTLRGERKREVQKHEGSIHRTERAYGVFERSFSLTAPVKGDQVKASYKDGVLEIAVPKAEEARAREIEVQVA